MTEEEATLQRILNESFNTSHPNFDARKAMENLRNNFKGQVALCRECLFAKHCTELEAYQGHCKECHDEKELALEEEQVTLKEPVALNEEQTVPKEEPKEEIIIAEQAEISEDTISEERKDEKDQTIARLEARIQYLEENFEKMMEFFQQQITHNQERADYYSRMAFSPQNF